MDVTPLVKSGYQIIQNYGPSGFKVSGQIYEHPVLVFIDRTVEWATSNTPDNLQADDLQQIYDNADNIDVVLLGCGEQMEFVSPALRQQLQKAGVSIEPMDTGAACRTFNVLMAEERRVVAALFPPKAQNY